MILLKIKIALQNSFKCLQEADWAWRHLSSLPTRSLAGSEKRSRVGSRVLGSCRLATAGASESGRQSDSNGVWQSSAFLPPHLWARLRECLEIWKNCEERQAVAPPAAWPSVIPGLLPPLEKLLQKLLHFMESILFSRKHLPRISLS